MKTNPARLLDLWVDQGFALDDLAKFRMSFVDSIDRDADASALVPEDVSREIIKSLPKQSAALSRFRRVTMSRKQQRMPVLSALPVAYWVNGDTGLKGLTKAAWANKYLNAEEVATIVPIPEALLDDSDYPLWDEVQPLMEEAAGILIDQAVFFGTGSPDSWPDAIVPAAAAAGNTFVRGSVGGQRLDVDISDAMTLVENDGFDVNGHVLRRGMKGALRGLRDSTGQPIFLTSVREDGGDLLYGEPLSYLDNGSWDNAAADLITGDYNQGIMAVRQDITWKLLDQAVLQDDEGRIVFNLAQQDMVAMRMVLRVAFQVANPITRSNTNDATRYPFAVLRPTGFV